jgi:hypothetical protein
METAHCTAWLVFWSPQTSRQAAAPVLERASTLRTRENGNCTICRSLSCVQAGAQLVSQPPTPVGTGGDKTKAYAERGETAMHCHGRESWPPVGSRKPGVKQLSAGAAPRRHSETGMNGAGARDGVV